MGKLLVISISLFLFAHIRVIGQTNSTLYIDSSEISNLINQQKKQFTPSTKAALSKSLEEELRKKCSLSEFKDVEFDCFHKTNYTQIMVFGLSDTIQMDKFSKKVSLLFKTKKHIPAVLLFYERKETETTILSISKDGKDGTYTEKTTYHNLHACVFLE